MTIKALRYFCQAVRGNSGNLDIRTKNLKVKDGGVVGVGATSSGNAGLLNIEATESIAVTGRYSNTLISAIGSGAGIIDPQFRIFLDLPDIPSGQAVGLKIITPLLVIEDGGIISVQNDGPKDAGDLRINADQISIDNASILATAFGNGGNIDIDADLLKLDNGTISASAQGDGTGGNIDINAKLFLGFGANIVSANALSNQGGNIRINTVGSFLSPTTEITATSEAGAQRAGTVTQNTERTGAEETSAPAPDIETPPQLVSACNPTQGRSSLVVLGPGNLKATAHHLATTDVPWNASQRQLASDSKGKQTTPDLPVITEAIGWQKIDGKLVLIAEHQDQTTQIASQPATCDKT